MNNTEKEFNDIVIELSKRKLDYNYAELQRIKDRSHQIVAFFLVIVSIASASLTATSIQVLLHNNLLIGILIVGFGLTIFTMSRSFKIMIGKHENLIIDPKSLYEFYKLESIANTKEAIRDSMFDMLDEMDKRNLNLHYKMYKIYELSIMSLVIMFIPMIWLIFSK